MYDNNNNSLYLNSALYTRRASQSAETYHYFMQGMGLSLNCEIYSFYISPSNGLPGAGHNMPPIQPGTPGRTPSLFDKLSALSSFTCVKQHTGPMA